MNRIYLILSFTFLLGCAHGPLRSPAGKNVQDFPILSQLAASGQTLSDDTHQWTKKWDGMDLEQTDVYSFPKLTGSSSVNLKIQKADPQHSSGFEALGIFLGPNDTGNPTAELAYFNMSAILGWDGIMRPAARYELGPKASQVFLALIKKGVTSDQQSNADNIVKLITAGAPLQGCLKAERDKTADAVDSMCDPKFGGNGGPDFTKPVMASLQVTNPAPVSAPLEVMPGFKGDALQLAIEYSVVMTFDVIFQQGDRYSGGNLGIRKDMNGQAHFYSSDNGGGGLDSDASSVTANLALFSRFERRAIAGLRKINQFLLHPETGFLGYQDSSKFVSDLGFYFGDDPANSAKLLQRNIQMLLDKVDATVAKYGNAAFLN